jgi:hypothetical protein
MKYFSLKQPSGRKQPRGKKNTPVMGVKGAPFS